MCYRENHFWPIVGPRRSLLTPARSRTWPVNKYTSKISCVKLVKLPGPQNKCVRWFSDPMLPKKKHTNPVDGNYCPYPQSILEIVVGGIFFTSYYD